MSARGRERRLQGGRDVCKGEGGTSVRQRRDISKGGGTSVGGMEGHL